jgi:hypothetical protein
MRIHGSPQMALRLHSFSWGNLSRTLQMKGVKTMHVHGANSLQLAAFLPTQATQQMQVERRAAAAVRRKLIAFGSGSVEDEVARAEAYAEAYAEGERQRQRQDEPPDEEAFRQILIAFDA